MSSRELSVAAFVTGYKSKNSRKNHGYNLGRYLDWLESEGIVLEAATSADILRYLDSLRAGLQESSVDNALKSIRVYYKWLMTHGAVPHNPAALIHSSFRRAQTPPEFVPPNDLRLLLDSALSERDWAFIALVAFGSLRVSEIINCDVSDLELRSGRHLLHFKPDSTRKRPPYVALTTEVAEVVRRQLEGRSRGPLFVRTDSMDRLTRQGASTIVRRTAQRAGIPYPVSPQMLTYTLPMSALQRGYSYRGLIRAMGVPDRRNSERWLAAATDPWEEDNASIRLARFVMSPPDSSTAMLMHAEALLSTSDMPEAFGLMAVGAVVERHLRLVGIAHGISPKEDAAKGSITYYVGELQRISIIDIPDARKMRAIGDMRNDAAHGWFDRILPGDGHRAIRDARLLLEKYPVPVSELTDTP